MTAPHIVRGVNHDENGIVKCSIVIPTIGRWKLLTGCLDAIEAQGYDGLEIVVVIDGDMEPPSDFFSSRVTTKVLRLARNSGQAAARNAGVAASAGDVIAFLDDDMIMDPSYVAIHMAHHHRASDTRGLVVLGRIVEVYDGPPASATEEFLRARRDQILSNALATLEAGELSARFFASCGASCSVTRSRFQDLGGFDENLRTVYEDTDLGLRLMDAGVDLIVDRSAVVRHVNHKDLRATFIDGNTALGAAHANLAKSGRLPAPHARRLMGLAQEGRSKLLLDASAKLGLSETATEDALEKIAEVTRARAVAQAWTRISGYKAYRQGVVSAGLEPGKVSDLVERGPQVLAFHAIGAADKGRARRFSLAPSKFRALCESLARAGLTGVSLTEAIARRQTGKHIGLTFDDGYADFLTNALPVLREFGFGATVYIVTGLIGKQNAWDIERGYAARRLLSLADLRILLENGIELGSHSVSHAWLPALPRAELSIELRQSRQALEDMTGSRISTFAYPSGGVNVKVRCEAIDAGYDSAVTAIDGANQPLDRFAIERWQIDRDHSIRGVMRTLSTLRDFRTSSFPALGRFQSQLSRIIDRTA